MAAKKVKGTKQTFVQEEIKKTKSIWVKPVKCLNERQKEFQNSIKEKEITIVTGLSGSGKTFLALYNALKLLEQGYKKIVLVKSVTTVPEEELGFLPGDAMAKMQPFMMSYTGNLNKLVGEKETEQMFKEKVVEILPLAYIRGINIDDSVVILDEAQNITVNTFKSIITRIGTNSKYIIMGDTEQIDMKERNKSALVKVMDLFKDSDQVGTVQFTDEDCVRNPIIPYLLDKIKEIE